MILIYIICLLLNRSVIAQKVPLKMCPSLLVPVQKQKDPEISENSGLSNCLTQREEQAGYMHQGMLYRYDYKKKVTISCSICSSDNRNLFRWFFIPRSEAPLLENNGGQASIIRHFEKELFGDMFTGTDIPCYMNETYDLYIPTFNPTVHLGTYICRHILDRHHLSNRIWHHLDVISSPMSFADPLKRLPKNLQAIQNVKSSTDVKAVMQETARLLQESEDFKNYNYTAMEITSKIIPISNADQTCGDYTLTQYRRCYVIIPSSLSPEDRKALPTDILLSYDLLITVFKPFYIWMEAEDANVMETQRKAAESAAIELGFDLYYDGKPDTKESDLPEDKDVEAEEVYLPPNKHYYIPCHFTYFRHFSTEGLIPRPYIQKNLFVNISFKHPCPEVGYMEIINLALSTSDVTKLKSELLGYEEKRFMKIEKVALEDSKNFEILCGGEGQTAGYNCSDPANMTIMWKHEDGVTYQPHSEIGERIYITEDCKLLFTRVRKYDEGVYSCYKRLLKFPNQWRSSAFVSYRLKIEASSIKFPPAADIYLGLVVITVWALILIFSWILLSFWAFEINKSAIIQASERKRRKDREIKMAKRKKFLTQL